MALEWKTSNNSGLSHAVVCTKTQQRMSFFTLLAQNSCCMAFLFRKSLVSICRTKNVLLQRCSLQRCSSRSFPALSIHGPPHKESVEAVQDEQQSKALAQHRMYSAEHKSFVESLLKVEKESRDDMNVVHIYNRGSVIGSCVTGGFYRIFTSFRYIFGLI